MALRCVPVMLLGVEVQIRVVLVRLGRGLQHHDQNGGCCNGNSVLLREADDGAFGRDRGQLDAGLLHGVPFIGVRVSL
jgi:hypothetical protein